MVFVTVAILVGIILGGDIGISHDAIIGLIVFGSLVFGSMAVWNHANAQATGSEWWQDDSCSGWRGY
jgi:hypothetical protein